ncbi:hypothetical protein O9992_18040 [Vibrio lentus]|nr:hypothetical protein [Vibrio lentus]
MLNRSLNAGEVVLPEYQVTPARIHRPLITEGMTLYPLAKVSDKNLINDYIRPGTCPSISSP